MIALMLAATFSLDSAMIQARKLVLEQPAAQQTQAPEFFKEPILQDPKPTKILPFETPGNLVGKVALPSQLDKHRDLLSKQLGPIGRLIAAAGDAGFKNYFLSFAWADQLVFAPLGDLNRLRGDGINVRIDGQTAYNFKVSINIFSPVRGSTFKMTPIDGTRGPKHEVKTGVILDSAKAKSYVFNAKGTEYWLLHGTDVDPATNRMSTTRSLLFVNEAGLSSKAWPLAESELPVGANVAVTLKDRLILRREADGTLTIHETR